MVINAIPSGETNLLLKSEIMLLREVSDMITFGKKATEFYFADLWEARMYTLNITGKYWGREEEKNPWNNYFK